MLGGLVTACVQSTLNTSCSSADCSHHTASCWVDWWLCSVNTQHELLFSWLFSPHSLMLGGLVTVFSQHSTWAVLQLTVLTTQPHVGWTGDCVQSTLNMSCSSVDCSHHTASCWVDWWLRSVNTSCSSVDCSHHTASCWVDWWLRSVNTSCSSVDCSHHTASCWVDWWPRWAVPRLGCPWAGVRVAVSVCRPAWRWRRRGPVCGVIAAPVDTASVRRRCVETSAPGAGPPPPQSAWDTQQTMISLRHTANHGEPETYSKPWPAWDIQQTMASLRHTANHDQPETYSKPWPA